MLDALGLFVGLPPLVAEQINEHPLSEAMTPHDVVRQCLARLGKMHFFTSVQLDETLSLEPVDHLRDRGSRQPHEPRETRADHIRSLVGEGVDGLQVFLDRRRAGDDC